MRYNRFKFILFTGGGTALITELLVVIISLLPDVSVSLYERLLVYFSGFIIPFIIGAMGGFIVAVFFIEPNLTNRNDETPLAINPSQIKDYGKPYYLEYELNVDDIFAFHLFTYQHSPSMKLVHRLFRMAHLFSVCVLILAAILMYFTLGETDSLAILIVSLLGASLLVLYFSYPLIKRKTLKLAVFTKYSSALNTLIGKHKLTISLDTVTNLNDAGESTTYWNAIEWVESTDEYLFMVVRGSGPYIVPRRAFNNEEAFRQFAETANAYHQVALES